MSRTLIKGIIAGGAAVGVLATTPGTALPASGPNSHTKVSNVVRAVAVYNQTQLLGQGLSPAAALRKANHYVPYAMTTAHYIPSGFQMTFVRVYPFMPGVQPPADTVIFQNLRAPRTASPNPGKPAEAPAFEIDHQGATPFVYNNEPYFTISSMRLGGRSANVAEQKYRDFRTHKSIDLIYVYWFDSRRKVATEVTSELVTSRLSRAQILRIAASVS